jgi:hypothetical protein
LAEGVGELDGADVHEENAGHARRLNIRVVVVVDDEMVRGARYRDAPSRSPPSFSRW